ncbi:DNA protecting protein DprA [Candidatus Nomurabacteria bacterium RIFCSPLOWO2_02_FULL_40_10]|uniref:DNA protecting protein DprA n=2 Tax=Candidatus Nomuraibacteriota TaxID=1752729 RepID=A0A1F6Y0N4_9BACT|nr:MAG: DNA protecting protein DprA [Candidatus Nomurabacteria bacterium RIFCSPHIGHO2_01_FULL_39_10]OGI99923.1 MAG: DNA protecting protein DprA [Candidatus Nomurabacteria bacterium RIFCSPLOWO2_02_FULL_40_10]
MKVVIITKEPHPSPLLVKERVPKAGEVNFMKIKKLSNDKFPKALLEIPQPPQNLWIIGELPKEENLIYLSVVGSRKFTSYGREACEKIIAGLKGYPIVIVSGFAMGIDTIAHKKAMQVGLTTIVFPGSGLSDEAIYPKTNVRLMNEVVESGGCLISEFEPDFKATQWGFPMRNRLMAGISKAVLIIEAEERSGTLITARLTTEYNRDLLVVPGSIFSSNSKGTNRLLKAGATPVTCSEDVLEALGFELPKDEEKQKRLFENLSPEEKKVTDLLHEPIGRDDLIRAMKMPIPTANAILSVMEIKGLIKEEMGEIRLA